MCQLSQEMGRQVGLFLDRRGQVEAVFVGDARRMLLPDFGRLRAGRGRFRGLRLVHTHLGSVELNEDDLTDLALLRLDLVASLHQAAEEAPVRMQYAHLLPATPGGDRHQVEPPQLVHLPPVDFARLIAWLEETFAGADRTLRVEPGQPPALLVCVTRESREAAQDRIREIQELARTAGVEILEVFHQRRPAPDPRLLVGRGKLEEVVMRAMQLGAEILLVDPDLSPAQSRAIGDFTELKVVDRTMLILDIFAQRAVSREGKLQVELAQLRYALPRLVVKNTMMSRLTGGIGGRGPGETKLEINRRRARERISQLEREIDAISRRRALTRQRRKRRELPVVAIVGYTNAGKSTLLNSLTSSHVFTEDKLFATLDPTTRRLRFPEERELVLTDTVGFIRELPKDLTQAFRATLEELGDADMLIHLVDASEPSWEDRLEAVDRILADLSLGEIERVVVWNKVDRLPDRGQALACRGPDRICLSAIDPESCRPLLELMSRRLWR
jgi:GTP-binding protein HflX